MKIVIRADASVHIGLGHVMRCLTLAKLLHDEYDAEVFFLCREHEGNMNAWITQQGFQVLALPVDDAFQGETNEMYGTWLGACWQEDAQQCSKHMATLNPDWLIVDHYALDASWEHNMAAYCHRLLVIDDLANRHHACDVLLDQTYGRENDAYDSWVTQGCRVLLGTHYALLRAEFLAYRDKSLLRRSQQKAKHICITMGGIDQHNATGKVLTILQGAALPKAWEITVVMGRDAPWLKHVQAQVKLMDMAAKVVVHVDNMAEIMASADVAIGASGSGSWERCCLGLPSIMLTLAENQTLIAAQLAAADACIYVGDINALQPETLIQALDALMQSDVRREELTLASSRLVDGKGAARVLSEIMGLKDA